MAVIKNMMVRAGADFSAITKQASKASNSMRGMQKSVSRSCNAMSNAAAGLKKAFGLIGIGVSLTALVSAAKDAVEAFDEQTASEMRLAQVMRNTMAASNAEIQSILDLADAEEELGIVEADAQIAGAQELATYLSLGSSLKKLIPVMNDMAVQQYGFNVTAEQTTTIATMLGKVMSGQVSGLSRYGYYFDEAQEAVLKFGTESERAAMLAEVVSQSVGGMNYALAQTPTGRMKQLSNVLENIKQQFGQAIRTIGTVFLPLLNALGKVLAGIATIANRVAQAIANAFGGSVAGKEWQWAGASAGVSDTADAVEDLTNAQNSSAAAAKKQSDALQTASFDTLNILKATDSASGGGSGSGSGAYGGGGADAVITETETAAEGAGDSMSWLEQKLSKLKEKIEEFKEKLDFSKLQTSWQNLKTAVSEFAETVGKALGPVWDDYLEPLAVWTINTALPAQLQGIANVIQTVTDNARALGDFLSGDISFSEYNQRVTPAKGNLLQFVLRAMDVATGLYNLQNALVTVKAGIDLFKRTWQTLTDKMVTGYQKIKEWDNRTWDAMTERINKFIDKCKTKATEIWSYIKNKLDSIKKLFEFNISFPHIKMPHFRWDWESVGSMFSLPRIYIDWYEQGGVFDRPRLIGVGENGREAVVPLEKNTGWIRRVAGELAVQMGGGIGTVSADDFLEAIHDAVFDGLSAAQNQQSRGRQTVVPLYLNGREFARAIYDDTQAVAREHGVNLVRS